MSSSPQSAPCLDRVVVRYARLDAITPGRAEQNLALLSDDERRRCARRVASERLPFAAAHALVRRTLSLCADRDPAHWRFAPDAMGKPEIADPRADEKWTFNLSHTPGLVACVVARTSRVGIDVEWAERRRSYPALARRVLAPAELRDFEALAAADRKRRFLDYWTLKEAHLKARGTGLRTHLAGLEFRLLPDDGAECVADSAASPVEGDWHYLRLRPTPLHLLAVAFANTRPPRWEVKEADA